ncbi:WD40/YVTN/BNR-like repeat-containing protein [Mucilaginibacter sp. AW1-3]
MNNLSKTSSVSITRIVASVLMIFMMAGLTACKKTALTANTAAAAPNPLPVVSGWTRLNVPNDTVTLLEQFNNVIYAASNSNKLYTSTDEGATWSTIAVGSPDVTISAIQVFNNQVYVGTHNNGIFSSNDGCKTWVNYVNGFQDYNIYGYLVGYDISSFAVRNNTLYVSTSGNGVRVLNQQAGAWSAFNNNLPQSYTSYEVFKIANTNTTLVAAAGVNGTFYYYDPTVGQWVETLLPHWGTYIDKMIVDNGVLYATTTERKIIRSDNNGVTWNYDTTDLQAVQVLNYKELYNGTTKHYVLTVSFGGNQNGTVIQQRDKNVATGTSWAASQQFLEGIHAHAILESGGKLFLGTNEGLYYKNK